MTRQPQTMLSKLGFDDADSKSPEHDRIVSWLYKAIDEILPTLYHPASAERIGELRQSALDAANRERNRISTEIQGLEKKIDEYKEPEPGRFQSTAFHRIDPRKEYGEAIKRLQGKLTDIEDWGDLGEVPEIPQPRVITKSREKTIKVETNYSKTVIGFMDFQAIVEVPYLTIETTKWLQDNYSGKDVPDKPRWYVSSHRDQRLNFEVKSRINNIGQVFRQINLYREYEAGFYFVVAPDDTFVEELKQEKITFIKAPAEFAPPAGKPQMALW
jgi:hypothetical protein